MFVQRRGHVKGEQFLPQCRTAECEDSQVGQLDIRASRFVHVQEMKVQELNSEMPDGEVPCAMSCLLIGDQTNTAKPGQSVAVTGVCL